MKYAKAISLLENDSTSTDERQVQNRFVCQLLSLLSVRYRDQVPCCSTEYTPRKNQSVWDLLALRAVVVPPLSTQLLFVGTWKHCGPDTGEQVSSMTLCCPAFALLPEYTHCMPVGLGIVTFILFIVVFSSMKSETPFLWASEEHILNCNYLLEWEYVTLFFSV